MDDTTDQYTSRLEAQIRDLEASLDRARELHDSAIEISEQRRQRIKTLELCLDAERRLLWSTKEALDEVTDELVKRMSPEEVKRQGERAKRLEAELRPIRLTDREAGYIWDASEFQKGCPFCKCELFYKGPTGGLSINFWCKKCGARFNAMGPFGVELTEAPKADAQKGTEDVRQKQGPDQPDLQS